MLLTKDSAIRRNAIEQRALIDGKLAAFMLASAQLPGDAMAVAFQNAMPRILKVLRRYEPKVIASVTRDGGVSVLFADSAWLKPARKVK